MLAWNKKDIPNDDENTLWTELGIGFWSGSSELKGTWNGGDSGTEKIEYSIMPMNISVGYSLSDLLPFDGIYAGAGFGANRISMTQTVDSDTPKENSGFGTIYHLMFGYDYPLTEQLSLGAELQIALGSHKHVVDAGAAGATEDISLTGPKILLQVNYLFPSDND
jgi:opacity protein-like surface antigen